MEKESQTGQDGGYPHKDKHFDTNNRTDIKLILRRERDLGRDTNDGGNDGSNGDEKTSYAAEQGQEQAKQACDEGERGEQHQDKVDDGACQEEAKHDLLADSQQIQNCNDLGRQGDLGSGEEFADKDLDRVEPVERFRL